MFDKRSKKLKLAGKLACKFIKIHFVAWQNAFDCLSIIRKLNLRELKLRTRDVNIQERFLICVQHSLSMTVEINSGSSETNVVGCTFRFSGFLLDNSCCL